MRGGRAQRTLWSPRPDALSQACLRPSHRPVQRLPSTCHHTWKAPWEPPAVLVSRPRDVLDSHPGLGLGYLGLRG